MSQGPKDYSQNSATGDRIPAPATLREAVLNHNEGLRHWNWTLAEFFDTFYFATEPEQRAELIVEEPPVPLKWKTQEPSRDRHIYLGGIIEHLAKRAGIEPPDWVYHPSRYREDIHRTTPNGTPYTDEEIAHYRRMAIPECAARNDIFHPLTHQRGPSLRGGFDEKTLAQRRANRRYDGRDTRALRLVTLDFEENGISPAEGELRRKLAYEVMQNPGTTVEEVLKQHGYEPEDFKLDLSPVRPFFKLPEDYGRSATPTAA